MVFRVRILGNTVDATSIDVQSHLLLTCIEGITGSQVVPTSARNADLTIIYPYRWPFSSTTGGTLTDSAGKLSRLFKDPEFTLRRLFGIPRGQRVLAVSHENLDRSPWQFFGNLIRTANVPRLTFWPGEIDPGGFRFPYWWNYVDWPEMPRPAVRAVSRIGRHYSLDELLSPQVLSSHFEHRSNRAIWLTRHLDFPRKGILSTLEKFIPVDVVSNVPWERKGHLLRQYRYCVVTENSPGYGYETEKLPEARSSGCIPIGHIINPFGDFNSHAAFFAPPETLPDRLPPLLSDQPRLTGLLAYLSTNLL